MGEQRGRSSRFFPHLVRTFIPIHDFDFFAPVLASR